MVTTDELLSIQQDQTQEKDFKLAKVVSLFPSGTAKIQFYGEDTASEKEYSYLSSYKPKQNDIVLVIPFSDTYIIAGRVLFQITLADSTVTEEMLNAALSNYATLTAIANFVTQNTLNNTLSSYSQNGHSHDQLDWENYRAGFNYILNNVPQFIPSSNNIGLGASNYKWKEVYAVAGTINTSDLKLKNSVKSLPQKYKDLFMLFNPVIYKMNDGTSNRFHVGFGAQHVERAMKKLKMDSKDFAGLIKTPVLNKKGNPVKGKYDYGLRYTEFIGLNAAVTQDNSRDIQGMKKIINEQQNTIKNLIERIEKLEEKEGVANDTSNAL